jgi:hypothetical protein
VGILNTWNAKGDERFNGGLVFSKVLVLIQSLTTDDTDGTDAFHKRPVAPILIRVIRAIRGCFWASLDIALREDEFQQRKN